MKRLLTILATALLLTAALCVSASASDFDSAAQDLSAIGMFRGTVNGGFELDRAPKRSEAAIMLVRLYGAEEEADAAYKAGEISHPFKDVGPIASPYVAWLYTQGITKGTTATTFGSNATCTDKNYVVFLLRALGYQDGTDFQYAGSLDFAEKLGFYQTDYFKGTFLRDDLAAVTLQALATDKKGGETYLLKSLIDSGAVDAAKAKALTEKIEAFRALSKATETLSTSPSDIRSTTLVTGTVKYGGETMTTTINGEARAQTTIRNGRVLYASETKMTQDGETTEQGTWIKDGWLYIYANAGGVTMKNKVPFDDAATAVDPEDVVTTQSGGIGLAFVKSISAAKSGSNTVYSVTVDQKAAATISSIVSDLVDTEDEDLTSVEVSDMLLTYTLNSQGQLNNMKTSFTMKILYASGEFKGDPMTMNLNCSVDASVLATGSAVTITFPDFSDYVILTTN